MAGLTIYKDNTVDFTAVSNLFIDEYMKDANDAQLKIYLYLLRMMNAQLATSVSDIADKFNHTEKDVVRALKYWEKAGLLALDFDKSKNLVGIHIHDLNNTGQAENRAAVPSTFVPVPSAQPAVVAAEAEAAGINTVSFSAQAYSATPEGSVENTLPLSKPAYSAEQLREFKNRQNTSQLLFVAESYIGRPLTPAEMKTILYFTDVLRFSDDLIDYLLQYCVERGKKDFKYIEKVAVSWAEQGITTPKQAQKAASRYDKNVYAIMNELGKSNAPTPREAEYIMRWIQEYGFSNDIIFEACERTVLATDKNRFEYAERILQSWHEQNVHHKSDICKIDELYQQRRKNTSSTAAARQYPNRFSQFTQNTYDFDALEKELLSN
ncbi:MAG: DnaD domain protein [Butyrivibrio sp.]|nr:DnaD domain protein [Acetatifactor muris]MCM1558204.1 DnaD domain protein [Butyrivibrio sp.]